MSFSRHVRRAAVRERGRTVNASGQESDTILDRSRAVVRALLVGGVILICFVGYGFLIRRLLPVSVSGPVAAVVLGGPLLVVPGLLIGLFGAGDHVPSPGRHPLPGTARDFTFVTSLHRRQVVATVAVVSSLALAALGLASRNLAAGLLGLELTVLVGGIRRAIVRSRQKI
jgi:hypothetical protein